MAEDPRVFTDQGGAPTLTVFAEAYGDAMASIWMWNQLYQLCRDMGWFETLTAQEQKVHEARLHRVADGIVRSYGWLRVTELMFFLNELQDGLLGHTFMLRNVEKVTDCLREFIPRLMSIRSRHYEEEVRQKRAAEAEERAREGMNRDEWIISEMLAGRRPGMLDNPLLMTEADRVRITVEYRRRWYRQRGVESPTAEQLYRGLRHREEE